MQKNWIVDHQSSEQFENVQKAIKTQDNPAFKRQLNFLVKI